MIDDQTFPLRISPAQRRAVAVVLPELRGRLQLDRPGPRTLSFALDQIKAIARACQDAIFTTSSGVERNSLRHVVYATEQLIENHGKLKNRPIPVSRRLYQFRVTLEHVAPPIWRRFQVKECTLDRLHEHIQTSMGWTNSHLHQFNINGMLYADPDLLFETWEDGPELRDSVETRLCEVLPEDRSALRFVYEYDFGDSWMHEVLFEGCLAAGKGGRYPLCLEGERACPPEDVGGVSGYTEFLAAIADPNHEEHESYMEWAGPFDPERFDEKLATRSMRTGLPDWRADFSLP